MDTYGFAFLASFWHDGLPLGIAACIYACTTVIYRQRIHRSTDGTLTGQEDRNRSYLEHIEESTALLAMVHPEVIVLAHTASSYTLGRQGETALLF